jgi:hypothetical protein
MAFMLGLLFVFRNSTGQFLGFIFLGLYIHVCSLKRFSIKWSIVDQLKGMTQDSSGWMCIRH